MVQGYLNTKNKIECFGCEACASVCAKKAISMQEDKEGFRYPVVDTSLCTQCGMCNRVCPSENMPLKFEQKKVAFGGYHLDKDIRMESTSGGAFTAIVHAFCDENYVIFGAETKGIEVFHSWIFDKNELYRFRKSKYLQSKMGASFVAVKKFLMEGKKVLFSGTPCQVAGLKVFLGSVNQENLLTVEVICEGVPSPYYVQKYEASLELKYGSKIEGLDYRFTDRPFFGIGKWDFEVMQIKLQNKTIKKDRWFNPFWSVWLNHLMSRPSCYHCPFTTKERVADITLGDLWGVHLYCPELYGSNGGASLVVCNSQKGIKYLNIAKKDLYGHELDFDIALKYQSPMRQTIRMNPQRDDFMKDLTDSMSFEKLNKKWAKKPSIKLLWSKYVWGNRQKIFVWNLKHQRGGKND